MRNMRGKAKRWVTANINQSLQIARTGIEIKVCQKWNGMCGSLIVSVGGLRWKPYKSKKAVFIGWDKFTDIVAQNQ